jgi:hypothetical protein
VVGERQTGNLDLEAHERLRNARLRAKNRGSDHDAKRASRCDADCVDAQWAPMTLTSIRVWIVALVASAGLGLCGVASADDLVTFSPPAGAPSPSAGYFRTTDHQPTMTIQSPDSGDIQCSLGPFSAGPGPWQECGPPPAQCPAVQCATFRPASAVTGGWDLSVQVLDPYGTELAHGGIVFDVDTTPPNTSLELFRPGSLLEQERPTFSVSASDDDPFNANVDTIQCSFGRVGATPSWYPCPSTISDETDQVPYAVPRTHVDYELEARAVDDLGQADPTPATAFYDPLPCLVSARAVSIRSFISAGLPITVRCSYFHDVAVDVFSLGANGHRVSVKYGYGHRPRLGGLEIKNSQATFTAHRRLRLSAIWDAAFRQYRSDYIAVHAFDAEGAEQIDVFAVVKLHR